MRTVAIIQARMGSSRLPGKVLELAAGKPLLVHMIERLKRCETLDDIVVALPEGDANQPIVDAIPAIEHLWWTRGPEDDVLSRVLQAAKQHRAELIVELTGDCPLIDPAIVDGVVREFMRWYDDPVLPDMDFVTNSNDTMTPGGYPRGMDVRVFPIEVLAYLNEKTSDPVDREHVSLYVWEHPTEFQIRYVLAPPEHRSPVRLTVDTPKDLTVVRLIFEALYPANPSFGLVEILAFLATRPDLVELNRSVQQKATR